LESHKLPRKNLRKTQVSLRKVAQLPKPLNQFLPKVAWLFYICSCTAVPEETAEPIVDLLNRGVSVVGIAARENLTAKRSRPEMAPQRLEKIESAPGNGMGSEASNPQDVVHGPAATGARLRWMSRENDEVAEKGA
jgi:hypothetical protein